jgi:polyketide synthase 12
LTAYQRDIVAVGARYPDLPIVQAVGYTRLAGTVDVGDARMPGEHACETTRCDCVSTSRREFVQRVGTSYPSPIPRLTGDADPEAACRAGSTKRVSRCFRSTDHCHNPVLVDRTDSF